MSEQTEAQRLADELVALHGYPLSIKAAAELRTLDAELERKSDAIQRLWAERDSLRASMAQLLKALEPDRQLLQQALDAMRDAAYDEEGYTINADLAEAHDALETRLAQCDRSGKRLGGEGDIHTCTPDPIGDAQDKLIAEMAAQPEQEPVAWLHPANATCVTTDPTAYARGIPLYTNQPAAPMTEFEEAVAACDNTLHYAIDHWQDRALKAEAKLAQPEQEPVAEVLLKKTGGNVGIATVIHEIYSHYREPLRPGDKLYTTPPAAAQPAMSWEEMQSNYLDLLSEVTEAKEVMRSAGCEGTFLEMFGEFATRPAAAPAQPEGMGEFLADLERSRTKYPANGRMFDGLMGEVDELRRAYAGDGDVRAEAFDVAVCAFRIATEGDAGGNTLLDPPEQEPVARVSLQWLAEMILSDCGHSSNYTPLLDRVKARIEQWERANSAPTPPAAAPVQPVAWVSAVTGDVTTQDMSHTVSWVPLATPPAAAPVPEGWKLAPIEPTDAMCLAGVNAGTEYMNAPAHIAYKAMLAAAPVHPEQEPVYHLRQYGDVTKEQFERYAQTGSIAPPAAAQPAQQEPVAFYVYEWINPSDGVVFRSFRSDEYQCGREPDRTVAVPAPPAAQPAAVQEPKKDLLFSTVAMQEREARRIEQIVGTLDRVKQEQLATLATPPAAQHQCKWPTCQSEEYQQALAEQISQELVTGAAQQAPMTEFEEAVAACDNTLHYAIDHWQDRALKAEAKLAQPEQEPVAEVVWGAKTDFEWKFKMLAELACVEDVPVKLYAGPFKGAASYWHDTKTDKGTTPPAAQKTNQCGETCERAKLCATCGGMLAQPEQEPVAWMFQHGETGRMSFVSNDGMNNPELFLAMNPRYALVCALVTPPAAQPAMFGPMGTVGDLFDKHVIANGNLKKEWIVYLERNNG